MAPIAADAAASTIANARCGRESACGQIGPGHAFATQDACIAELAKSASADMAAHPCPAGIDSNRVAACVKMLQRESCYPLSTLSRMYTCRPANLCGAIHTTVLTEEEIYGD